VNLATDIVAGHSFTVDLHLDTFIPFKFTCAVCGANCSISIPIVKQDVTFALPACPLPAGPLKMTTTLALPATSPVPIKASAKGKVTVNDPTGATVANLDVKGSVSPSLQASKKLLEGTIARKYFVNSDSNGHYGDPSAGCMADEKSVQITGVAGDVCTPACAGTTCPTDVPTGVTATPICALQDTAGNKYCILECTPSQKNDAQCGTASCKAVQGVGICTYDDA